LLLCKGQLPDEGETLARRAAKASAVRMRYRIRFMTEVKKLPELYRANGDALPLGTFTSRHCRRKPIGQGAAARIKSLRSRPPILCKAFCVAWRREPRGRFTQHTRDYSDRKI